MQCPRCQQDNPPQAKFCLECGNRLVLTCAQCGTELAAALELYRAMDMTFWLPQVEAALAKVG